LYLQKIINGRNLHIASMGASATFGEMSFLSGSPASATVSAETDVVVYIMEGYFVNILFNLNPAFAGTRRVVSCCVVSVLLCLGCEQAWV